MFRKLTISCDGTWHTVLVFEDPKQSAWSGNWEESEKDMARDEPFEGSTSEREVQLETYMRFRPLSKRPQCLVEPKMETGRR